MSSTAEVRVCKAAIHAFVGITKLILCVCEINISKMPLLLGNFSILCSCTRIIFVFFLRISLLLI